MREYTGEPVTVPDLYDRIPEDIYHADCVPAELGGSLSVSGGKKLLAPSCPAIYKYERDHPSPPTPEMERGTVIHAMLLGTPQPAKIIDAPNYQKKATQEARDTARMEGRIPMLPHQYAECEAIAQAVVRDPECAGLLAEGDREVSGFWRDEEFGIWLRLRMDSFTLFGETPTVIDLKTTADASPDKFAKQVSDLGYYQQSEWYREGLAALLGCDRDDVDFIFIAVPTSPPYLPMAYRLEDPKDIELGRARNRMAREIWRDCRDANVWPKWGRDITPLTLPGYARKRIEDSIREYYD